MITVPEVTEEIIRSSPFMEEALSKDLINLSSLARQLKPKIQSELEKRSPREGKISDSAIIMALKRLKAKLSKQDSPIKKVLINSGDLAIRSNITEYTFVNSPSLSNRQLRLLSEISSQKKIFYTFTDGIFETSLFISSSHEGLIDEHFEGENLKRKLQGLSSITLILPEEASHTPGVYYSILKLLAWDGINFIEVLSSFTELTIFLDKENVDKAFRILKNLS